MGFAAGAGIINCDLLYSQVERLPSEGEEVYSGGFDIQLGGGAPAIMVNLSRLHVPVHFQTFLGKDLFSMHIRGILEEMGMEYRNLYRGEGMPLNITSVAITPEDRTFLTYAGPVELTKREKEEIYRCSSGAKVVKMFMAGGDPEMADIYRQLKREGSILTMDTGWEDGLSLESYREFLELADYYTPNEREALKITGARSVPEAAEVLEEHLGRRDAWVENQIDATRILAYCRYALGEEEQALGALLWGLSLDVPRAETCCGLGRHFLDRGQLAQAQYWFRQALQAGKNPRSGAFIQEECYGLYPAMALADCCQRMGELREAEKYRQLAAQIREGGALPAGSSLPDSG